MNNFLLQGLDKHIPWFRCGGKGEHLNPASRLNATANSFTTNALQGFQQLCPWFRSQPGLDATDCKCAPEMLLAGVSTKRVAEWPGHLNRKEIQEIHRNTLRNFLLRGFNKHLSWFRCGAKGKHLNLEAMLNPTLNQLTTNALQDFQQPCPRFRSQAGMECHRPQMCPRDASGWGIHQTRSRTAQASEPEQKPRNSPQFIE